MIFLKIGLFVVCSAWIIWVSRRSLRQASAHGFYRFFAWEAIVALMLLNLERWFANPLSWHQLISWVLLFTSFVPVIWGTLLLRRAGRPAAQRDDSTLFAFEKTTRLVTDGIYNYIRHPLYSSLLLLTWGAFFKQPFSLWGPALAGLSTALLWKTAVAEEAENLRFFGDEYRQYMQRSRMFIPYVF